MISLKDIIKIIVFLISLSGVTDTFFSSQTPATTLSLVLNAISLCLLIFVYRKSNLKLIDKKELLFFYFIYGILILIYSLFISTSYEQNRYVITVFFPSIFLPLFSLLCAKLEFAFTFIKSFFLFSLPLSILKYISGKYGMHDFTHYVSFIYLILLCLPYLRKKWKIIIVIISLISFFYDLNSRSNILNFSFIGLLFSLKIFKKNIIEGILKKIRIVLLFLPILLTVLSFLGFNVFTIMDEYKKEYSIKGTNETEISLVNDSRTGVYLDAWYGVSKDNNFIFGISAAGYHDTFLSDIFEGLNLQKGRLGSEVGILEYLLRGGLVFVVLIVLIHYYASKLAIKNSNNLFCKYLGVYVSFRLFFLFIEAQVNLNLSNISTFIVMGLCFNNSFRNLNNKEMKNFLQKVFYKIKLN